MQKKCFNKPHGQAEMPEWDDQASKHQCYKKMKTTPVWTPCQHKLTFYNGENLHQISVNYVYRQALNCKVEDKKLQTIFWMAARLHYTKKRYTWRHNNLIKYITGLIDIDRFLMHADIPSHTLPGGGTYCSPPPPCDRREIRSSNYQ